MGFTPDELQDYENVRKVAIRLDNFATVDNVRKISETLGKPPEEVTIAFGGFHADACVDAHLVAMCRRTYTLHPRDDIATRLDLAPAFTGQPLANQPLGTGVVLDDIVDSINPLRNYGELFSSQGAEIRLQELKMRLKHAHLYRENRMLMNMRRVYQSLARESDNDSFKYWCLVELMYGVGFPYPSSNPEMEMIYNALREIGWNRAALVVARSAGLKHEESELKEMFEISDLLDAKTAFKQWISGTDPRLVAEDLIQAGDFRRAALTAARFGGYHLAFELASRIEGNRRLG